MGNGKGRGVAHMYGNGLDSNAVEALHNGNHAAGNKMHVCMIFTNK